MEYIKNSKHVPLCGDCGHIVRPGTFLYGEMVDSQMVSRTTQEISRADVLLVLGTSLRSDVYSHYIRYFQGKKMIIITGCPGRWMRGQIWWFMTFPRMCCRCWWGKGND